QILVPREKVLSVPAEMTIRKAFQFCQEHNLTKVPIHDRNGEWIGVYSVYDVIYSVDERKWDSMPVSSCAVRLYFIEDNLRLGELLERMRFRRIPFFAVLDRSKKPVGIVRPEDLAALLFEN
ncbi:MAG: CBS domain-containing protein, partial [Lentisphaeria bacterium]|nr:CBS domain-containing protein [Lentisphaeria bacterium]